MVFHARGMEVVKSQSSDSIGDRYILVKGQYLSLASLEKHLGRLTIFPTCIGSCSTMYAEKINVIKDLCLIDRIVGSVPVLM
jgi:hypothetical protein